MPGSTLKVFLASIDSQGNDSRLPTTYTSICTSVKERVDFGRNMTLVDFVVSAT